MQDITDVHKINEVFLDVCMDADIIALNVAELLYTYKVKVNYCACL